jgi:hypothetical protein
MRKLLLIAATLIVGAELVDPGAVHDMHAPSPAELITQPARKLLGWIRSERTSAVQEALPAACWEIFPMFDKPTIGNNQQRWGSVALGFEPAIANPFDAQIASRQPPNRWRSAAELLEPRHSLPVGS